MGLEGPQSHHVEITALQAGLTQWLLCACPKGPVPSLWQLDWHQPPYLLWGSSESMPLRVIAHRKYCLARVWVGQVLVFGSWI